MSNSSHDNRRAAAQRSRADAETAEPAVMPLPAANPPATPCSGSLLWWFTLPFVCVALLPVAVAYGVVIACGGGPYHPRQPPEGDA
jgi:hypothetical protein